MNVFHPSVPAHNIAVFSGGGVKGAAYAGALQVLRRECALDWGARCPPLQVAVGCSIGSIMALCIVLGYTASEIQKMIDEADLDEFLHIEPFTVLSGTLGLDDGKCLRDFLATLVHNKLHCGIEEAKHVTLLELKELMKMELHVAVTDMTNIRRIMLTPKANPTVKIVDAVYASCALPPIFAPLEIDGVLYADGGLIDNYPVSDYPPSEVIGFRLQSGFCDAKPEGETEQLLPIFKYIQSTLQISNLVPELSIWYALPKEARRRTVSIYCQGITSMAVRDLSAKKATLYGIGEAAMLSALQSWKEEKMTPDKSEELLSILPSHLSTLLKPLGLPK